MAVTSKHLRAPRPARRYELQPGRRTMLAGYAVALVAGAVAISAIVGLILTKAQVALDDLRYGRPRTAHLEEFVGHGEEAGYPTHLMALNLNRQVMVIELPGGDAAQARTISGPYLFGADADLTPVLLEVQDVDGDGLGDLLLDIRNERVVYLNRDGTFRLPTPDEQALLNRRDDL